MTADYWRFGFFLSVITGVLAGFACAASCPPADLDGNDPRTPFTGTVSSSAIPYSVGFSLSQSADLKARIYKSSTQKWSPLNEAFYQVQNP
jgi:hypothetical protein